MAILLASSSAIRATLLKNIGLEIEAIGHGVDERALMAAGSDSAAAAALRLAAAKAESVLRLRADRVVVAADQVLSFDGAALGKPRSLAEARERFQRMRGRRHRLETAAAIGLGDRIIRVHRSVTVRMRNYDDAQLDAYLAQAADAALRSSSGYEIEGLGGRLIEAIEGDYFSALGLPLFDVVSALEALEALK